MSVPQAKWWKMGGLLEPYVGGSGRSKRGWLMARGRNSKSPEQGDIPPLRVQCTIAHDCGPRARTGSGSRLRDEDKEVVEEGVGLREEALYIRRRQEEGRLVVMGERREGSGNESECRSRFRHCLAWRHGPSRTRRVLSHWCLALSSFAHVCWAPRQRLVSEPSICDLEKTRHVLYLSLLQLRAHHSQISSRTASPRSGRVAPRNGDSDVLGQ
ncbi:LOW QUALITY PROTEIN: hypothetical protein CVT26_003877 [Gymnopilus dilepis]|uniref:Uncharacterized protein n=1 Tax=Gymnopilus dilepis TaxID=231916 RepID=A0A409X3H4_9AGAR|nr:LOW QUALITY PROTEIN: hypothetical protein CVT26_003877 [Gymnopilus dilepis]